MVLCEKMKCQLPSLRRQILEDVLGDNVEEYENFHRESENKRQHRQRIPLWQFLLHLLNRDKNAKYIEWNRDYDLEFRIKDTIGVAELWGSVKNKTDMTYEKLGRAMRYYYGKSIIEKVTGRRYSYRFILSRKTKKYLSQFINVSDMKMQPAPDSDHSDHENEVEYVPEDGENKINDTVKEYTSRMYNVVEKPVYTESKPVTKTKIFKPDGAMFKDMEEPYITRLPTRNNKLYKKDEPVRRSAFSVPVKRKNSVTCTTKIMSGGPLLDNIQEAIRSRKRSYPYEGEERDAIAYCCCGSHNCKVKVVDYSSEDSETDSTHSYGSISPQDFKRANFFPGRQVIYEPSNVSEESFFVRKDSQQEREGQILQLQQNLGLNKKIDPFMGFDYSENPFIYDSFDELLADDGTYKAQLY